MILHIPYSNIDTTDTTSKLFKHPTAAKITSPNSALTGDIKKYESFLIKAIEEEKEKIGSALIIDCKTFTPDDEKQARAYPDIYIGSDPFHTPLALLFSAVKHFRDRGYSVKVNAPFSGTFVPMRYFKTDRHVCSMRIEVNRDLYKDALEPLQSDLSSWLTGYLEKE